MLSSPCLPSLLSSTPWWIDKLTSILSLLTLSACVMLANHFSPSNGLIFIYHQLYMSLSLLDVFSRLSLPKHCDSQVRPLPLFLCSGDSTRVKSLSSLISYSQQFLLGLSSARLPLLSSSLHPTQQWSVPFSHLVANWGFLMPLFLFWLASSPSSKLCQSDLSRW